MNIEYISFKRNFIVINLFLELPLLREILVGEGSMTMSEFKIHKVRGDVIKYNNTIQMESWLFCD